MNKIVPWNRDIFLTLPFRQHIFPINNQDYLNYIESCAGPKAMYRSDTGYFGAVGICDIGHGIGEVWMCLTDEVLNHKRWTIDASAYLLKTYNYFFIRVQTHSHPDDKVNEKFFTTIGFTKEGILRRLYQGQDMTIWCYEEAFAPDISLDIIDESEVNEWQYHQT